MISTAPVPSLSPNVGTASSAAPTTARPATTTYAQILKSTAVIGGSSVANVGFSVVRTKAMALMLGPSGVGLMGMFNSVAEVVQSLAGMGIQNSGVRQIAEAVGSNDLARISLTITVLRRVAVVLGALGALLLLAFAGPISRITFGDNRHATGIALLSLVVFFKLVSNGQVALIQGMRRIQDLARESVVAAALGTAASIPIVYVWGERGIIPALIAVAALSIATTWYYSRKVQISEAALTMSKAARETGALLKMGFAFMASGFLTMGAAYAIRIIVLHAAGLQAAGLYQAAWALGGLYVGFILQAMGADFYPRLTAVAADHAECTRLVNEQAQISLLLAGPGVIATLAVAPLVLGIFYSAEFQAAVGLLRWICLGMTLRVVAWPLGYIIVAKGAQAVFFWTEVAATAVHVGLAWLLVSGFGPTGAGAAFFGLYVWHGLLIYTIVRRTSGFRWSASSLRIGAIFLPLTASVFASFYVLPGAAASTVGLATAAVSGVYSVRTMLNLMPVESIPPIVWSCARLLRLTNSCY